MFESQRKTQELAVTVSNTVDHSSTKGIAGLDDTTAQTGLTLELKSGHAGLTSEVGP